MQSGLDKKRVAIGLFVVGLILLIINRVFFGAVPEEKTAPVQSVQLEKLVVEEDGSLVPLAQEEIPSQTRLSFRATAPRDGLAALFMQDGEATPTLVVSPHKIQKETPAVFGTDGEPWILTLDSKASEVRVCVVFGATESELSERMKSYVGTSDGADDCTRILNIN